MTEAEKETAVPFTAETRTKQEMVTHLIEVHDTHLVRGSHLYADAKRTRLTKEAMERVHAAYHKVLDAPGEEQVVVDGMVHLHGTRGAVKLPTVPHVHEAPHVAPEVASMLETVRTGGSILPGGKIMPPTQRTVLTKLVNNDFAALRADLQSLAAASLENDLKTLELEWEDRRAKMQTWRAEVSRIGRRTRRRLERVKAAALEDGIELTFSHRLTEHIYADARTAGYDKAVSDAKARNRRALDAALLKLERERLRLERRILLAGVEPEAAEVLEAVPSAQRMMQDAMAREGASTINT